MRPRVALGFVIVPDDQLCGSIHGPAMLSVLSFTNTGGILSVLIIGFGGFSSLDASRGLLE